MFIGFIEWGGLYQFQEQDPDAPPVMGYTPANNNSLLSWRGAGVDQAWNTDQNVSVHIDKNVYKKKVNIYYWYKKDKNRYKKDKNRYKKDKKDKRYKKDKNW